MQDNLDLLKQFLTDEYALSPEETLLLSKFKSLKVKKNHRLLNFGQVCQYVYFICSGCLRTCFIDEKGEEKTKYIGFERQFATALASFITQMPTAESIQALEDSELLKISQPDFYQLVDTNAVFAQLYRRSLEESQVFATWRIAAMISMTAKERYENLLVEMPQVVLRLSNKQVASFLGITQESLSRLKKKK